MINAQEVHEDRQPFHGTSVHLPTPLPQAWHDSLTEHTFVLRFRA